MNSDRPSENRIEWTISSLNFSLPIQQSIHNLVISKDYTPAKYQKHTHANSIVIQQFLAQHLPSLRTELRQSVDFDGTFWYSAANIELPASDIEQPSVKLNAGFADVFSRVECYLHHIHNEFSLPEVDQDTDDDTDVEDADDIETV